MEATATFRGRTCCSGSQFLGNAATLRPVVRGAPQRAPSRTQIVSVPQATSRRQDSRRHVCEAVAAVVPPPSVPTLQPASESAEDRAAFAHSVGYRSVGADLPDNVRLTDIISSLPKQVFEINPWRAWGAVATTVASVSLSIYLLAVSPWYLLPLVYAFAGTAWTGMFVVGHDCGHRSFSKNKLVEDIVGTIMFAPLIYPFEPWRIKHNHHHAHTNKLVEDTAWHPIGKDELESWGPQQKAIFKLFLGSPLKLWASVGHWWLWHFNLDLYTPKQKPRVIISLAAVAAFALGVLPALTYFTGVGGLVKFWLLPWLGYHFWMSTFTVVHHTAPHIPFKPAGEWNAAKAQLSGTVHCDYPRWIEFLCHDINVHVPHHVSSNIPWYNLRAATDSLRQNWGQYMTEASWNWRMMKYIFTELHWYDNEVATYVPFDWEKEEPFFWFQRKVIPSTM